MSAIELSVCILTYNHVNYISKCIESIINQETSFKFEIIISDDCSSDGTWEVLSEYRIKYPDIITIKRNEINLGPCKNYIKLNDLADKKYVAYLDGDDYAYPGKLQKQFDILEENPSCNVVLHAMDTLNIDGKLEKSNQIGGDYPVRYFNRDDLINYSWIGAHSSKMTRQLCKYKKNSPDFFIDFMIIFEELGVGEKSGIFISDRSYGVYRRGVGISAKTNKVRNALIGHLNDIRRNYKIHRHSICSSAINLIYQDIINKSDTLERTLALLLKSVNLSGILLFLSTLHIRKHIKL